MDMSKAAWTEAPVPTVEEPPRLSADRRRRYLHPSRYFHMYLFADRETELCCWLPEGYLA